MTINRRQFVQSSVLAGAGLMLTQLKSFSKTRKYSHFGLNPLILQNPDAVFIMQTNVDAKTNCAAIKEAGLQFGRSVFEFTDNAEEGIPLTHKIVIKPNLTCRMRGQAKYNIENSMGIVTDACFVEGIIERLKELGIASGQFYIREVNCPDDLADGGYLDMAQRTGIDLQAIDTPVDQLNPDQIQWMDVNDGVWFNKIPYLWPVNAPDTWLLNISKLKAHGMGMTLCAKNLQGTIAMNYQAHCTAFGDTMTGVDPNHINPSAQTDIYNNYLRHRSNGIPRWDKPGNAGGLWMETWASRCLDNNSVTLAGLHIIEGIYGRDGNFLDGPNDQERANDYMTNYIIFGRNQFYVDIIGHYLGGHEPGNFGLFHMAMERGMSSTLNPSEIPVFNWNPETGASLSDISNFQRYPLKTKYLQRNYNLQTEPEFHMVDEAYNYNPTAIHDIPGMENGNLTLQSFPNPVANTASINFCIPSSGHVSVEIINNKGVVIDQLVNARLSQGNHDVTWNSNIHSPGMYICRMRFNGSAVLQKLIVFH